MRLFSLHLLQFSPSASFTFLAPFLCPSSAAEPPGPALSSPPSICKLTLGLNPPHLPLFPFFCSPLQFLKGKRKGPRVFFIIKRFHHSHVCKRSPSPAISIQPPPRPSYRISHLCSAATSPSAEMTAPAAEGVNGSVSKPVKGAANGHNRAEQKCNLYLISVQ